MLFGSIQPSLHDRETFVDVPTISTPEVLLAVASALPMKTTVQYLLLGSMKLPVRTNMEPNHSIVDLRSAKKGRRAGRQSDSSMRLCQALSWAAAASSVSTLTFLSHVALSSAGVDAAQTLSIVRDFVPRIRFRRGLDPGRNQRSSHLATRSLESLCKPSLADNHDFNAPDLPSGRPLTKLRGTGLKGGADTPKDQGFIGRVAAFCNKRFFLVGAAVVIYAAKLAPSVGATGGLLHPEITVNKAGKDREG